MVRVLIAVLGLVFGSGAVAQEITPVPNSETIEIQIHTTGHAIGDVESFLASVALSTHEIMAVDAISDLLQPASDEYDLTRLNAIFDYERAGFWGQLFTSQVDPESDHDFFQMVFEGNKTQFTEFINLAQSIGDLRHINTTPKTLQNEDDLTQEALADALVRADRDIQPIADSLGCIIGNRVNILINPQENEVHRTRGIQYISGYDGNFHDIENMTNDEILSAIENLTSGISLKVIATYSATCPASPEE